MEDYAIGNLNYKETFSQWVETDTESLGNISGYSGGGSFKFGIFYTKNKYQQPRYGSDGEYAWEGRFGKGRNKAFNNIQQRVLSVIRNSILGDFEAIENTDLLFPYFKWKVAFLYSNYKLFPIYKKEWLYKIATSLGYEDESDRVVDLQKFIMKQYNSKQDFFEWYDYIVQTYLERINNFYVVGSNYGAGKDNSILPDMYERNVIAVGFFKQNMSKFYLQSENKIAQYLYKHDELTRSVSALTKFLSIQEGDIVAIKNYGFRNNLNIAAYAVVKPDSEGNVYKYDSELGHQLNVEFIESNVNLEINLNKSHTVHRITDQKEINIIFGAYQNVLNEDEELEFLTRGRRGTKKKNTKDQKRKVSYSATIKQFHNKLQQQFFEHLRAERNSTDDEFISMEENFVDIKFENKNCIELYEVKTSPHARGCIREALGQLIFYASKISSKKKMKLFVIGPSEMKESDRAYFNFVKDNLSLPFEYLPFRLQTGNI